MKSTLILLISFMFANLAFAQNHTGKGNEINFLTQRFSLNESQVAKATAIIDRKYVNFEKIQQFKTSNPAKYAQKLKALSRGTWESIRYLMADDSQREAFRQFRIELRKDKAQKVFNYQKNGLTIQEAETKYYQDNF